MTNESLNIIVEQACDDLRETLSIKGAEYCTGNDRLKNFKDAASMNGITPEWALWGMVSKHIIALKDFILDLDKDIVRSESQVLEKVGDIRCYMVLLEALFAERRDIPNGN